MHSVRRIKERPGTTLHLSAGLAKAANDRGVSECRLKCPEAFNRCRNSTNSGFHLSFDRRVGTSASLTRRVCVFCRFVYEWQTGFTMQIWREPSSLRLNASHSLPLAQWLMTSLISYEKSLAANVGGCCRLTVTIRHERVQDRLSEGHGELPSVSRSSCWQDVPRWESSNGFISQRSDSPMMHFFTRPHYGEIFCCNLCLFL